nr:diguanylate cyclase [uncultured Desulfobulbus sp.]
MKRTDHITENPILVVDDNPVVVKLLQSMLVRQGYAVLTAKSGQELLDMLTTTQASLILLDIDMPGISGIETCKQIKANPATSDIPVLIVTASHDKEHIICGFNAGAQDYIIKPSTKEELLARVRTHLALHQTQLALKASQAMYRKLSFLDDLTGLYNTRYLYQALQHQLTEYPQQPLSIIFIDIDSFKQVVDAYGHLNGSRAIAELAEVTRPLLPEDCFGVSYGGDEFVLVLPGYDRLSGTVRAEEIRGAIAANHFLEAQQLDVRLTISCGVASYPDDAETMVDLLGNADHALFESKRRGKNTVVSFAELAQPQQTDEFLPLGGNNAVVDNE